MFRASRRMRRATKWSPMAAVLRIDCSGPHEGVLLVRKEQASRTGNPVYRGVRQFDLTLRNSPVRDNVAWQAYGASRLLWKMTHHQPGSPLPADSLLPTSDRESEPHLAVASEFSPAQSEASRHRLPEVAFSLDGGESFRLHLGDLYLTSVDPTTGIESVYQFPMRIEPGTMLGGSVTLHPSGFLSREIFGTVQANLLTGKDPSPQVDRIKMHRLQICPAPGRDHREWLQLRRRCSARPRQCLPAGCHLWWRNEAPRHSATRVSNRVPRELCQGSRLL
jgi:hypothetical protein